MRITTFVTNPNYIRMTLVDLAGRGVRAYRRDFSNKCTHFGIDSWRNGNEESPLRLFHGEGSDCFLAIDVQLPEVK